MTLVGSRFKEIWITRLWDAISSFLWQEVRGKHRRKIIRDSFRTTHWANFQQLYYEQLTLLLPMKLVCYIYLCLFWTQKRLATRSGVSPCFRTKNVKSVFPEFSRLVNCSCFSVVILSSLISLVLISNCWLKFASHFCQIWSSLVGLAVQFTIQRQNVF